MTMMESLITVGAPKLWDFTTDEPPAIAITCADGVFKNHQDGSPRLDKGKGKAVETPIERNEAGALKIAAENNSTSGKSRDTTAQENEVDWTEYDPPDVLLEMSDDTSELASELTKSAIQSIKAQIMEEKEMKRKKEEQLAQRDASKDDSEKEVSDREDGQSAPTGDTTDLPSPQSPVEEAKASAEPTTGRQKRTRPLARFFRRIQGPEKGESSTLGVARVYRFSISSNDVSMSDAAPGLSKNGGLLTMLRKEKEHRDREKSKEEEPEETIECMACFEDTPVRVAVKTTCHSYCAPCFGQLVATAIEHESQWPPKCCLNEIPAKLVARRAPKAVARTYLAKSVEYGTPVSSRLYCPTVNCGLFIPPPPRILSQHRLARCGAGHTTCTSCRRPAHSGACRTASSSTAVAAEEADAQLTDQLAADEGWRRCPRCGVLIEHRSACQHMTCRCGSGFCYVCGAAWRTCACTVDDLNRLKARATTRRNAREAEDRQLREAIERFAAMEREEAAAAERARLAERRARAESRRRAREERARREETRRRELAARYAAERDALAALGTRQGKALESAHEASLEALTTEQRSDMASLAEKHASVLEALRAEGQRRIRARKLEWEADFATRAKMERRLESAYAAQLEGLWRTKADGGGEARRQAALRAYMDRNDARLDAWRAWRDSEMHAFRFHVDDELAIRDELLGREAVLLRDSQAVAAQAMTARSAAEARWFDLVHAERLRLLAEMEDVERECGGDDSDAAAATLMDSEADEDEDDDNNNNNNGPDDDGPNNDGLDMPGRYIH